MNKSLKNFADNFLGLNVPVYAFLVKFIDESTENMSEHGVSITAEDFYTLCEYKPFNDYVSEFENSIGDEVSTINNAARFIMAMQYFNGNRQIYNLYFNNKSNES